MGVWGGVGLVAAVTAVHSTCMQVGGWEPHAGASTASVAAAAAATAAGAAQRAPVLPARPVRPMRCT